ncbi:1-deoxy-D-xylulose-5-phosphate synthase [Klebsiella grimontii]|uniref:1-deoxy-D-xylulose-5-phosphate synthase n=1 Tax=Klebsiella grimontii TaxID=2058152 RepID=A0A7H4P932_9ENTR|nr:1-deoxy-D-xylulose-5-phosphate synthase [Klebsiella grimontii]
MTPSDENECRQMLYTGYHYNDGPCAVRYPRGSGTGAPFEPLASLPIGKGVVKREGEKIAILNFGTLLPQPQKSRKSLTPPWWICALPNRWMRRWYYSWPQNTRCWSPWKRNAIMGGAGSGVNELLMSRRRAVPVLNLGLPDFFIPQGTQEEAHADLGLDAAGIEAKIHAWLA